MGPGVRLGVTAGGARALTGRYPSWVRPPSEHTSRTGAFALNPE
jgi:hypothetical protein